MLVSLVMGGVTASGAELFPQDPAGFDLPRYEGIDQVLVLSDRWVVVATVTAPDVIARIDARTNGAYGKALASWRSSQIPGQRPDWTAWKTIGELRDRWYAPSRVDVGELELGKPESYQIQSLDLPAGKMFQPARVFPAWVGLDGDSRHPGSSKTYYAVYAYLELPAAMAPGGTYRIVAPGGRSATLRFDPDRTIARTIKVNQVGYRPGDQPKFGYLGAWIPGSGPLDLGQGRTFDLVDADSGEVVVAHRPLRLRDDASRCLPAPGKPATGPGTLITGEVLYELDFSEITRPGRYYLRIPGVGRSWPFPIAEDAYGPAFYVAMRGLFHQRASFALERPFTAWTRPRWHTDPVYESAYLPLGYGVLTAPKGYERFDVIGATLDRSQPHQDVIGGWYDAADYDRNLAHYTVIFDLLWLFEQRPGVFTDGQLNLPESGNGIPDLLDEVEFGLRLWLRSMDAEGGVSGAVEAATHPSYDDARFPFAFSRRTRFASLHFAAAAAQFARVVHPYSAALADRYATAAKRAFLYGTDPAHALGTVHIPARRKRGLGEAYEYTWEEKPEMELPFLIAAQTQLALLTGEDSYLKDLGPETTQVARPYVWPFTTKDYSPWLSYAAVGPLASRIPEVAKRMRPWYFFDADQLTKLSGTMPYRQTWPRDRDFWLSWGASLPTNPNRALLAAQALDPQPERQAAILANAAASFGANPLGLSWTTGIGFCYPQVIQHEWSERNGIADPVPGLTIYGITESMSADLRKSVWIQEGEDSAGRRKTWTFGNPGETPVWRRWSPHPTLNTPQCEFTVHETVTSTILTCGMLMSAGWMPDQALTHREPRSPEHMYGYWYLP